MKKFTKNALTVMAFLVLVTPLAIGTINANAEPVKILIRAHKVIKTNHNSRKFNKNRIRNGKQLVHKYAYKSKNGRYYFNNQYMTGSLQVHHDEMNTPITESQWAYKLGKRVGQRDYIHGYYFDSHGNNGHWLNRYRVPKLVVNADKKLHQWKYSFFVDGTYSSSFEDGYNAAYRTMPKRDFASHVHKTYSKHYYINGYYYDMKNHKMPCLSKIVFLRNNNKISRQAVRDYIKYNKLTYADKIDNNINGKAYQRDRYALMNLKYNYKIRTVRYSNSRHKHPYNYGRMITYMSNKHHKRSTIIIIHTGTDFEENTHDVENGNS